MIFRYGRATGDSCDVCAPAHSFQDAVKCDADHARDEEAAMQVLNRDCFDFENNREKARKALEMAQGFSVDSSGMGNFNGGIINPQREHLKPGNMYYRFVSAATPQDRKTGGVWWIDHETLMNIMARYRATGGNDRTAVSAKSSKLGTTLREWLALTFEWNFIEEALCGTLMARLDAYSGFGRVAEGGHVMDKRGYGYAPHLQNMFTIKQFCVPEFWVHQKKAMPVIEQMPLAAFEKLMRA
jgi:hypothetical protein